MTGVVGLFSIALRLFAVLVPLAAWRRTRDRRLIGLAAVAVLLLAQGLWAGTNDAALSATISLLALASVMVAVRVLERRLVTYRRIAESEMLHRRVLESISEAVLLTDESGRVTHALPAAEVFFAPARVSRGVMLGDLMPNLPADVLDLGDAPAREVEIPWTTPPSPPRQIEVCVLPIELEAGRRLVVVRDITALRGVERQLDEALAEVQDLKDRFEAEALYLQDEIRSDHNIEGIIGASPDLHAMLDAIQTVADTEATVLIRGETGVGKELVARAIHDLGSRRERPLVKVNCAALPANLVESELFGHEKGAFTGALARKKGRFELADGGTLFLDEIGELPLELQPKLLRALQEGEFERVGGTETLRADLRLLAATNRDLKAEVDRGNFRADLYYRLNVFPIDVPPLRERSGDIPLLASHFLTNIAAALGRTYDGFTRGSVEAMLRYPWPGNVRELRNVVERAALMSGGGAVDLHRLLSGGATPEGRSVQEGRTLVDVERKHIEAVLSEVGWVIEGEQGAARILDMHPSTLRARMKKLGIRRPASV